MQLLVEYMFHSHLVDTIELVLASIISLILLRKWKNVY